MAENASVRIDNINKIVSVKIEEKPSTIAFAILKQDYDDEEMALQGAKFKVTDTETDEEYIKFIKSFRYSVREFEALEAKI